MTKEFCYVRVEVARARYLANECISRIMKMRAQEDAEYEASRINEWNKPSFLDRLFRRPSKQYTKEDVIKYVKSLSPLNRLFENYPSQVCGLWMDKCKAILASCDNSADGHVYISADTLRAIQ